MNTSFPSFFYHLMKRQYVRIAWISLKIWKKKLRFLRIWEPLVLIPGTMWKLYEFYYRHVIIFNDVHKRRKSAQQECILVGCVPSAAVAVSPATHTHPTLPRMRLQTCTHPCHACPPTTPTAVPPVMPTAMHAAYHTCPPPHTSPPATRPSPATHVPCHVWPQWTEWLTDTCKNITFPQLLLRKGNNEKLPHKTVWYVKANHIFSLDAIGS